MICKVNGFKDQAIIAGVVSRSTDLETDLKDDDRCIFDLVYPQMAWIERYMHDFDLRKGLPKPNSLPANLNTKFSCVPFLRYPVCSEKYSE